MSNYRRAQEGNTYFFTVVTYKRQAILCRDAEESALREGTIGFIAITYHYYPVKHGMVKMPNDWPYSTFHRLVKEGVYPLDWCGDDADATGYGE
jgi:hypothetical protein